MTGNIEHYYAFHLFNRKLDHNKYGQMDGMKGTMKSVSKKDYLRYVIYCAERTKTMRIKRDGVNSTIQS